MMEEDPNSVGHIKEYLSNILAFLYNYSWLTDSYVSDFFAKQLHEKVPSKWWHVLCDLSPEELASLLHRETWKSSKVWPLSLAAFRTIVTKLCPVRERQPLNLCDLNWKTDCGLFVANTSGQKDDDTSISNGQYQELLHCYRRHVKPKKQHEIIHLAEIIKSLCKLCSCDHVVDVGAGQGHLARLLAFGHHLHVTTLEAVSFHTPKAEKFDREVIKDVKKGKRIFCLAKENKAGEQSESDWSEPSHVIAKITPDMSTEDFLNILHTKPTNLAYVTSQDHTDSYTESGSDTKMSGSVTNQANIEKNPTDVSVGQESQSGYLDTAASYNDRFILTGLHACGDLTATMLRVFVQCPQIVGLTSVGCCYMKLSTESDTCKNTTATNVCGYPLSAYVSTLPKHQLSYEAREMACHFIDCYHERLKDNSPQLRCHAYRAALQEIIEQKAPHIPHGSVKVTVKHTEQLSFVEYARSALMRLDLNEELTDEQVAAAENRLKQWHHVVAFYTLRLSLAPLIETVLLLDRALYLIENGIQCQLVSVFNPKLSPRNFVLVAKK